MNKYLSLLTTALLLTGVSSAFAAPSTDLTVKGTITPGACTPSLANGGVVNYGVISAKDLNQTDYTDLPDKAIQLTVNCDAPTRFAIIPLDNRNLSSPIGSRFGLGLINGNEKLGGYILLFKNPVADIPVKALYSLDEGRGWLNINNGGIAPNIWVAFGNAIGGVNAPDFLQNVTVDMSLETVIAPAQNLTLTNEVQLDGSATLQIEYL